jgi:ribosomal protein L11 methyltransferase
MPDADWKESHKQHFKAQHFGRLHWVPVWERSTYVVPSGDAVLWLDPGMAFGTGNHETTRLCCERLVAFAAERAAQGSVIDAGCGSGILALSAALLGFSEVHAFDNDPVAIDVSRENAHLNSMAERVDFRVADLELGLLNRKADLVLANIQADVLVRHAPILVAAVKAGGQLVLSGILASELEQVRAVFAAAAARDRVESRVMGEWSDLVVTRSA